MKCTSSDPWGLPNHKMCVDEMNLLRSGMQIRSGVFPLPGYMAESLKRISQQTLQANEYAEAIAENERQHAESPVVQEYIRRAVDFDKQLLCEQYKLLSG